MNLYWLRLPAESGLMREKEKGDAANIAVSTAAKQTISSASVPYAPEQRSCQWYLPLSLTNGESTPLVLPIMLLPCPSL